MRAGSLRSAPLAGLVSAHHAVHAGPCSIIRVASAWRKKLQTHKCGSAYPNCAICSPRCYGAGGTALSTCCIGPSGEDAINSELCAATIESADRLCAHSIYNCSTSPDFSPAVNKICDLELEKGRHLRHNCVISTKSMPGKGRPSNDTVYARIVRVCSTFFAPGD